MQTNQIDQWGRAASTAGPNIDQLRCQKAATHQCMLVLQFLDVTASVTLEAEVLNMLPCSGLIVRSTSQDFVCKYEWSNSEVDLTGFCV